MPWRVAFLTTWTMSQAGLRGRSGPRYNLPQLEETFMTPTATPVTYGRDAALARFSLARYQRMIETGILTAEDKVELLENYVVLKMPHNPLHDGTIQVIGEKLTPVLPPQWRLRVRSAVVFTDSQPEPDLAVVRGNARTYLTRHPGPADVGLLIEVADTSLLRDQRDKTRIYARGGIVCYWIVNLVDQRIEVYTQPSGPIAVPAYQSFQTYQPGDAIPLILDGTSAATIPVANLLV
jgi:Uma2 family endonuclease